jgi:DNA-directed RNA polymerase subunit L
MADKLKACFSISNPELGACYSVENKKIDACFKLNITPDISGLATKEELQNTADTINDRIDGIVDAFEDDIENINERMVDTVTGSGLIEVTREDNTVILTSKTFVFEQGIAANTWEIEHNLNKKPSITVVDSAETVVIGDYEYNNLNTVTLHFNAAFAGKAYLN